MAEWQSEAQALTGQIHILAHHQQDHAWQAHLPGTDDANIRWLDAVPASLVPVGAKSQLREQAAEADALSLSQPTPAIPAGQGRQGGHAGSIPGQAQPTPAPAPISGARVVGGGKILARYRITSGR